MKGWEYREGCESCIRERDGAIVARRPKTERDKRSWLFLGTAQWSPPPPTDRYRFATAEEACRYVDQNF